MSWQAGVHALEITPDLAVHHPLWLAGFDNNRSAQGIHDDLWVRVLAISDGQRQFVLAACDLIGLFRSDVLAIKAALEEAGYTLDALVVCCSHTHSGPDTLGLWGRNYVSTGVNGTYRAWLLARIAQAIGTALTSQEPVTLRGGMGHVAGWIRNSRDPGLLDTSLPCLVAERRNGDRLATLVNVACHPEVLWNDNQLITSDFPHYLRQALEEAGGTAIYTSADLGGLLTPQVEAHTFEWARRMGEDIALQAEAVLADATPIAPQPICHAEQELVFPLDNPMLETAYTLGLIRPQVAKGVSPLSLNTIVSLTQLGPLAFLGCPGEVLPKLGLDLRDMLPGEIPVLLGLANDELGYILPKSDFVHPENYLQPGDQYEESMSVGPEAGPQIRQATTQLVQALNC
jgi:hypothetical protein